MSVWGFPPRASSVHQLYFPLTPNRKNLLCPIWLVISPTLCAQWVPMVTSESYHFPRNVSHSCACPLFPPSQPGNSTFILIPQVTRHGGSGVVSHCPRPRACRWPSTALARALCPAQARASLCPSLNDKVSSWEQGPRSVLCDRQCV